MYKLIALWDRKMKKLVNLKEGYHHDIFLQLSCDLFSGCPTDFIPYLIRDGHDNIEDINIKSGF